MNKIRKGDEVIVLAGRDKGKVEHHRLLAPKFQNLAFRASELWLLDMSVLVLVYSY